MKISYNISSLMRLLDDEHIDAIMPIAHEDDSALSAERIFEKVQEKIAFGETVSLPAQNQPEALAVKIHKPILWAAAIIAIISITAFAYFSIGRAILDDIFGRNPSVSEEIEELALYVEGEIYRMTAESIVGDERDINLVLSLARKDGRAFEVNPDILMRLFQLDELVGYGADLLFIESYSVPEKQYYYAQFVAIEPALSDTFRIALFPELEPLHLTLPTPHTRESIVFSSLGVQSSPGIWVDEVRLTQFGFAIHGRNDHASEDGSNLPDTHPETILHMEDADYVLYADHILAWDASREGDIVSGRNAAFYPDGTFVMQGDFEFALDLNRVTGISVDDTFFAADR